MEKLMMVPYINSPPITDMTMAGIWMAPLWARTAGSAAGRELISDHMLETWVQRKHITYQSPSAPRTLLATARNQRDPTQHCP
jgi:hypothetical protein